MTGQLKVPKARQGLMTPKKSPDQPTRAESRDQKDANARLAKPQRQHRIARILEQHAVTSQLQLVEMGLCGAALAQGL